METMPGLEKISAMIDRSQQSGWVCNESASPACLRLPSIVLRAVWSGMRFAGNNNQAFQL